MPKHSIRKDLSHLGFYLVLYILLVNAVAGVLLGGVALLASLAGFFGSGFPKPLTRFLYWLSTESGKALGTLILNAVSQYLVGMPVIAYIIRRRLPTIEVRKQLPAWYERAQDMAPQETPLRFRDLFALLPIIVFMMVTGSLIGAGLAELVGDAAGLSAENSQVEMLLSGNLWMTVFFVVLLAPLAEELFFRKLLIDQVAPISRRGAVLVSAMTFGFFHQNFFQIFYALFLGALFAIVYVKTERIRYTILLHMAVNLFGGVVLPHYTEGLDETALLSPEKAQAAMAEAPGFLAVLAAYYLLAILGCILFFVWLSKGKFKLVERYGAAPYRTFAGAYFTAPGQLAFLLLCIGAAVFAIVSGLA